MSNLLSELKKLRKKNNGLLTPEIVEKEARKEKSPLHNYFIYWDSPADQYRLRQAEDLIATYLK